MTQTTEVATQYVLVVVTDAELAEAQQLIADVLEDHPAAIVPTAQELLAIEYTGLAWDFVNGEVINPDPQPHRRPQPKKSGLPEGVYRCPMTGKLYKWAGEMLN